MNSIGIDIGGTKMLMLVLDKNNRIIKKTKIKTPLNDKEMLNTLFEMIKPNIKKAKSLGVAAAGLINHIDGVVKSSPNIPYWKNLPLKNILERKFKVPTVIVNDVNAFVFAEWKLGSAKNASNVVCLTLGTGVGGGIILNNKLFVGAHHFAGEVGHTIVKLNGKKCPCGNHGCLERYVAKTAFVNLAKKYKLGNKSALDITKMGRNKTTIKIWNEVSEWLSVAIVNIVNILDPEVIVIGGGISNAGSLLFSPLKAVMSKKYPHLYKNIKIMKGKFIKEGGAIGAALLSRNDISKIILSKE